MMPEGTMSPMSGMQSMLPAMSSNEGGGMPPHRGMQSSMNGMMSQSMMPGGGMQVNHKPSLLFLIFAHAFFHFFVAEITVSCKI